MSIKSDRWIRRMAAEQQLIEPFEPGQVREVNGERIVSYGTSSYGYDVRCADEFKIFTNIESALVDPKSFDAVRISGCAWPRINGPQEPTKSRKRLPSTSVK